MKLRDALNNALNPFKLVEPIMRNKLVKTLLVSILAATALSGCNSGGGSTNNSNANSNNSAQAATQTDSQQSIGTEGGLLSIMVAILKRQSLSKLVLHYGI